MLAIVYQNARKVYQWVNGTVIISTVTMSVVCVWSIIGSRVRFVMINYLRPCPVVVVAIVLVVMTRITVVLMRFMTVTMSVVLIRLVMPISIIMAVMLLLMVFTIICIFLIMLIMIAMAISIPLIRLMIPPMITILLFIAFSLSEIWGC